MLHRAVGATCVALDRSCGGCCDERVRFSVETKASPEQVHRALTDFSPRRLQIWHRTLDPDRYEIRDQGPMWAVAREASPRSPFWVVVRYDWSQPDEIRWVVEESSYGEPGGAASASRSMTVAADSTSNGTTPVPGRCSDPCCSCSTTGRWDVSSPGCGPLHWIGAHGAMWADSGATQLVVRVIRPRPDVRS